MAGRLPGHCLEKDRRLVRGYFRKSVPFKRYHMLLPVHRLNPDFAGLERRDECLVVRKHGKDTFRARQHDRDGLSIKEVLAYFRYR